MIEWNKLLEIRVYGKEKFQNTEWKPIIRVVNWIKNWHEVYYEINGYKAHWSFADDGIAYMGTHGWSEPFAEVRNPSTRR